MRKVYLDELPRLRNGIDWTSSIGYEVNFVFDDISSTITILDYDKSKQKIKIMYNGKESIHRTSALINANLSFVVGKISKEHKYNVGYKLQIEFYPFEVIELTRTSRSVKNNTTVKSYTIKCLTCGSIYTDVKEDELNRKGRFFKCKCCNDGFSYPEKLMYNVLKQLNVDFETQQKFNWSLGKIYDFYIPSLNIIIETNGQQHYVNKRSWNIDKNKQFENDKLKMNLALDNGIKHYIVIDCSESNAEYIRENILKSEMNILFNLDSVDWIGCNNNASSSLAKTSCNLWNNGMRSSVEIAKMLNISKQSVITYLKQFAVLELCDYNPKEEMRKGNKMTAPKIKKPIICLDNNLIFDSIAECAKTSENIFGVKLLPSNIGAVCRGNTTHHKGYHFMFYTDYLNQQTQQ